MSGRYSPSDRKSMSISPEPHNDKDLKNSRSRSPDSPQRRPKHKSRYHDDKKDSDYDSDSEYRRERSHRSHSRSRSRSHSRERDRRRHKRDRNHHSSRKTSRSSRWERRSSSRSRDYDRYDSDCDDRSPGASGPIGASGSEIIGYKSQPPNNTIMIRGLAQHITENHIRRDIIQCGLMPKDIRLIRKKDTGASRGFAFVEFATLNEAVRWMEMKQGVLMLEDQYRSIMQFSIPKDPAAAEKTAASKISSDWFCIKCGAQNFKRRDNCFKCHASRMESEEGGSGSDETCAYATKTMMLRNLDALTTEDSVMAVLNNCIPELVKKISAVCIGRDPLTSTSRGICYLGLESTIDALQIYGALTGVTGLAIDGKPVIVSYCKYNMGDTKQTYSNADQGAFPNAAVPATYTIADVNSLAEYAAKRYAKTPAEYSHYIQYYRQYFRQQISAGNSITLHNDNQSDAANAAAALAQSALRSVHPSKATFDKSVGIPNGTDGITYPIPDISKYIFDQSTGYQYDPSTGLYYDPNSTYYWNSIIQKYLFWDNERSTYALAPSYDTNDSQSSADNNSTDLEKNNKKPKPEKQDKVKVAKKIAKDMERWAKTLNQKKDHHGVKSNSEFHNISSSGSADIAFSMVLDKKPPLQAPSPPSLGEDSEDDIPPAPPAPTLVAAYGSESSGDEGGDEDLLDFGRLICNLCKRQLGSSEALSKHAKMSALHKQNLENRRNNKKNNMTVKKNIPTSNINMISTNNDSVSAALNITNKLVYRDRAKERRLKWGDPDEAEPSKLKEKYLKSLSAEVPSTPASVTEPIGSENVGNRLLQKMGWSEGQGLGKKNQGRTTIIQAEKYGSQAGLGTKLPGYTPVAGESYKDCVKKMMYARYQELTERENTGTR